MPGPLVIISPFKEAATISRVGMEKDGRLFARPTGMLWSTVSFIRDGNAEAESIGIVALIEINGGQPGISRCACYD
jgi:hypothetical protein